MNDYESAVFVSYAWGGDSERTVDELEQAFAKRGIRIVRDKKDLGYKGSIEEFEQRIGLGQCIIMVISDKYLRSEHCMHELVEIGENKNLRSRIFPIVLADARIYKAMDRLDYIQYWDEQIEQLDKKIKQVGIMTNMNGITADLNKYARIRASFDHLTDLLKDMNTLTPEMHAADDFSILINAMQKELAKNKSDIKTASGSEQFLDSENASRNVAIGGNVNQSIIVVGNNNHINSQPAKKNGNSPKRAEPDHASSLLENLRQPGAFRNQFVDALLQCNSMADPAMRQHIISQLPNDIKLNIGVPNASPKVQVSHIVQICVGYENGIQSLVQVIEFVEGSGSLHLQSVKKLLGLG